MAQYLNLHVGNFPQAMGVRGLLVIGQTTETGQQMVNKGENIATMLAEAPGDYLDLFTNNDHFLNGVRLACKKALIHPDNVTIYEYTESDKPKLPAVIGIDKKGRLSKWPTCFTAIEDALCQL